MPTSQGKEDSSLLDPNQDNLFLLTPRYTTDVYIPTEKLPKGGCDSMLDHYSRLREIHADYATFLAKVKKCCDWYRYATLVLAICIFAFLSGSPHLSLLQVAGIVLITSLSTPLYLVVLSEEGFYACADKLVDLHTFFLGNRIVLIDFTPEEFNELVANADDNDQEQTDTLKAILRQKLLHDTIPGIEEAAEQKDKAVSSMKDILDRKLTAMGDDIKTGIVLMDSSTQSHWARLWKGFMTRTVRRKPWGISPPKFRVSRA